MSFSGLFRHAAPLRALGLSVVVALLGALATPSAALAFQDAAADATEAMPAEAAGEGEAVIDDGAAAADDAPAADGAANAGAPPAAEKSFLVWMIEASGVFGLLILLISFVMVALVMMNMLQVRRDNFVPPAFIEAFEQRLNAKDYQGAYEAARADESLVARILAAGLSRLNQGYDKAVEGMQEVNDDESMALDHRLSYLALISSTAPMLGLMGTVYGMIAAFRVIAMSATSPKPSELADGISTALFTTIEGLVVAVPAMVFYLILRNRISRLMLEVSIVGDGLMGRFAQAGRGQVAPARPAGGPAPAGAPAAPQQ